MNRRCLLCNRTRIILAIALTAFVLVLAIRGAISSDSEGLWLSFGLHGRILIAVNVAFYSYLWWLAYWFVRGSVGSERVFMVGWFTSALVSPLSLLSQHWSAFEHWVSSVALVVALLSAVSLLTTDS